jgi:dTDP-4-amino-4,6-dideoxygalactose transaminase
MYCADGWSRGEMALHFDEYMKRFSGRHFFYGNATHAFKDVMVWLNQNRPKEQPNIVMPEYIPAKVYRTVLAAGYEPRFYEVYGKCEFDLEEIRSLIDDQTQAIFVVHYFGYPSKLDAIRRLATATGVYLIEDCAHTLCGHSGGKDLGTIGDCALFSIRKMLLSREGGFLVLNNQEWEFRPSYQKRVSSAFSLWGILKARAKSMYFFLTKGKDPARLARLLPTGYIILGEKQRTNVKNVSHVTEQYTRHISLDRVVDRRRKNHKYLLENISDLHYIHPLHEDIPDGFTPYSLPIRISDGLRDRLRASLLEKGIACGAGWPECPFELRFTRTAELSRQLLELPIHQGMTHARLDRIVECLHDFGKDLEQD